MEILLWIVGVVAALIAGLWLIGVLLRLYFIFMGRRAAAKVEKNGVDFTCKVTGQGWDMNRRRADDRIPCRLSLEWTHPDSGEEFEFKSPWFWVNPGTDGDNLEYDELPVRIVLSDPANLYVVDITPLGVELYMI